MPVARTDIDPDTLREMWTAGMGGDKIARHFGCGKGLIFSRAMRMGLPKRSRGFRGPHCKPWNRVTAKEAQRMKDLQAQGKKAAEIAKLLHRSPASVWRVLGDYSERGAPAPEYGARKCLCCGETFKRDGPKMFMCIDCRKAA